MFLLLSVLNLATLLQLVSGTNAVVFDKVANRAWRTMPTIVKDGAVQRVAGVEEQGDGQVVWQVLGVVALSMVE